MTDQPFKLLMLAVFLMAFLAACTTDDTVDQAIDETAVEDINVSGDTVTVTLNLDSLFRSYGVTGTIIIRRGEGDTTWIHNPGRAGEGFLPASTFKVVNTLIGLETGVVNTEDTLFQWDGKRRRMDAWEADMTLKQAFHTSCVPCFQEVARKIGTERMNAYLTEFEYGHMVVTDATLDNFWLEGPSRITPFEQLAFLERITRGDLPVSASSIEALREVMMILQTNQYQLYGKTGWSVEGRRNIGWYIGWYETRQQTYLFVTNVEPLGRTVPTNFAAIRHQITKDVIERVTTLRAESMP